jgi:hypothetical protein
MGGASWHTLLAWMTCKVASVRFSLTQLPFLFVSMLMVIASNTAWQVRIVLTIDELIPELWREVFGKIAKRLPVLFSHNSWVCVVSPLSNSLFKQVKAKSRVFGEQGDNIGHFFGGCRSASKCDYASHDGSAESDDVGLVGEDIEGMHVAIIELLPRVGITASGVEPFHEQLSLAAIELESERFLTAFREVALDSSVVVGRIKAEQFFVDISAELRAAVILLALDLDHVA